MAINDVLEQDDLNQGTSAQIITDAAAILTQVLNGIGMLLLWAFMIAFFSCPVWIPALVDACWTH